ncbi:hypothetical protein EYF80_026631 [Liparis tanakae]|uniref:Uncharacterized protein n=1 Tax=Liparis tanakae TaxID=230148 RepID=A0A4Z2HB96_9TELE|nr:hypothetical protein EYF80_026631 [Liparis tanakae]
MRLRLLGPVLLPLCCCVFFCDCLLKQYVDRTQRIRRHPASPPKELNEIWGFIERERDREREKEKKKKHCGAIMRAYCEVRVGTVSEGMSRAGLDYRSPMCSESSRLFDGADGRGEDAMAGMLWCEQRRTLLPALSDSWCSSASGVDKSILKFPQLSCSFAPHITQMSQGSAEDTGKGRSGRGPVASAGANIGCLSQTLSCISGRDRNSDFLTTYELDVTFCSQLTRISSVTAMWGGNNGQLTGGRARADTPEHCTLFRLNGNACFPTRASDTKTCSHNSSWKGSLGGGGERANYQLPLRDRYDVILPAPP